MECRGDAKNYDHATPWSGDMVGARNEMGIESRSLDEYGKMSISSHEKEERKKRKEKSVTGTISL
jgi:hypothetical protein